MDPIEVTARFDEDGTITPLEFRWKGGFYRVQSTGRRWQDGEGAHILIMVANGRIYKLTFKSDKGRWYIEHTRPEQLAV